MPDYSPEEVIYLGRLQAILENARIQRDTNHDEFDGLTFVENWQAEEKAANTFILPKTNEADTQFQSGIVRDSIISLVSQVANMDLSPDIHAYDENQFEITGLGKAMETIVEKYGYLDNDDEKQVMRAYELFKHGYYFIEETWEERWQWAKTWIKKFEGSMDASWRKKLKKLYSRPVRRILSGLLVYLGDITQPDFNQQSVIFTVRYRDFADAEAEYGRKDSDGKDVWDRWKYVSKVRTDIATNMGPQIVYNTWRLTEVTQNQVEEIKVQFKFSNEFCILLNGVLMTPVGMPLPWGYEDYNIVQQNLEPVHPFWAYGKSLVSRMKTNTAIYDELLKVGVLKTQKSLMPARANLTGRAVSRRMFMPGKVNDGIDPTKVPTFDNKETEGVTESEMAMISRIEQNIQGKTTPPGPQTEGKQTNAQIAAQQQAAKVAVGWFSFFVVLGEQKLTWLRLFNVLQNHFEPTDKTLDPVKQEIVKQFRITNQHAMISGKGQGNRMVIPTEQDVSGQQVADFEGEMQQKTGTPHEIIVVKPSELQKAKYLWEITCTPKQKKTSDVEKVLIRGMIQDLQAFPNTNWEYIEEEYAAAWGKDPAKMFQQQQPGGQPGQNGQSGQGQPGAQPSQGAQPQPGKKPIAGMPQVAKGMTQTIKNQMG